MLVEVILLVAIAFVWSRGTIFKWFRQNVWPALFDCPLCSGFWIGFFGHAVFHRSEWPWPALQLVTWLGFASLVGTCTLILCAAVRKL